jgi:cytochrome c peroxidase
MRRNLAATAVALFLLLVTNGPASAQDSLLETARSTFKPIPETPPAVPGVEATADRVELGKMLYFEPRLSESHTPSAATPAISWGSAGST